MAGVCGKPGCPNLVPCPLHGRPRNASWSPNRDRGAQARLRRAALERDGYRCQRASCGLHDPSGRQLAVHHVGPRDQLADVITVCHRCHRAVDPHAR